MEKIVLEILNSIPKYLIEFISTLGSPKRYPLKRLRDGNVEDEIKITQALTFVLISFLLIILLNAMNVKSENLWSEMASSGTFILIQIVVYVWTIYFAWRIVGSKLKFSKYLIIYCYHFGVLFLLLSLIFKISDGVLMTLDNELYENLIRVNKREIEFDLNWIENPVYIARVSIKIIGYLVLTAWGLVGWGAYRIINEASKGKSIGALLLSGILSWPVLLIVLFLLRSLNLG